MIFVGRLWLGLEGYCGGEVFLYYYEVVGVICLFLRLEVGGLVFFGGGGYIVFV